MSFYRTLNLGTSLFTSDLVLSEAEDSSGVLLSVRKKNGKHYTVPWTVDSTAGGSFDQLKQLVETIDISQMHHNHSIHHGISLAPLQISFPCFLLQAFFDPLTVIRASELFTVHDVCLDAGNNKALQFCAEEIWDLCSSSNHVVGESLPMVQTVRQALKKSQERGEEEIEHEQEQEQEQEEQSGEYNMILPLATTPLLMSLYCERGRLYHNGINITGDVLALTSATGQWAKVFQDILMTLSKHSKTPVKQRVLVDVALQCLVSYSYAIDYAVLAPCKNMVEALFPTDTEAPIIVLKRDGMSGLTCPLGVAMLTAYLPKEPISSASQVYAWNTILITIFSRLCEAISGQKNIRFSNGRVDPSELETPYRLVVGELQTILKRRLHLEWVNSSKEEKLVIIASNARPIKECLTQILTLFVNRLHEFKLPTLSSVVHMLSLAMTANNYGVDHIRALFSHCVTDTSNLVSAILSHDTAHTLTLPVIYKTNEEPNAPSQLQFRDLEDSDHEFMLAYIDAIVTTKVSPKIVYQPMVNPSYPSFSVAQNDSLHFEKMKINWDVELPVANICLIGNVNSGKSSIGGQLLSHLNLVSDRALEKMKEMANKLGREENLQYAWVMDQLREERAGGYTVMPKFNGFQTSTRRFTMIDNPGHNVSGDLVIFC